MSDDILSQLKIVTIPKGTQCHLYDWHNRTITSDHFVSAGPIDVLVRKDYGPVYSLIEEHMHNGSLIEEAKNYIMSLYQRSRHHIIDDIHTAIRDMEEHVDAILMARTCDGKIGLLYLEKGDKPIIASLQ
jgi:hypothetical protein